MHVNSYFYSNDLNTGKNNDASCFFFEKSEEEEEVNSIRKLAAFWESMSADRKKHFFKTVSQEAKKTHLTPKSGEKSPMKAGKGKGTPKKSKQEESSGSNG